MSTPDTIHNTVILRNGEPVTTSLEIAQRFGKRHNDVLRDIRQISLRKSAQPNSDLTQFLEVHISESNYQDSRGKTYPVHYLTKDGFTLLAMGYTGEQAMLFKIAYINEFNRMKAELEAIKDAALQMVQDKLFERFKHWPAARQALQATNTSAAQIDREHGWGKGRTARAKKSMAGWGLISPQAKAAMDKEHRRHAANVAAITRKAQLGFNFGAFEGGKA